VSGAPGEATAFAPASSGNVAIGFDILGARRALGDRARCGALPNRRCREAIAA
jgi:hypothetical protein